MSETTKKLTSEEYALKLYEMLKPSGWHDILKGFLLSSDFSDIIATLETCVGEGKRFTPPLKNVFRAFMECPFKSLRVIMLGQDPYPTLGVADGIAFSCSVTKKLQPSLRFIFNAVNDTVYNGEKDIETFDTDLKRWANQGVLLLNTALTTEVEKIGKHFDIWQPLIAYLIDMLNKSDEDYIWVFMGRKAEFFEDLVDNILNTTQLINCSHPASAGYSGLHKWQCNDVFNKVNLGLKLQKKLPEIVW